jgi:hypothetical protein
VLLFDICTIYQHFQIQTVRKQLIERQKLFRLIAGNAADMIAVVDTKGPAALQQAVVRKDSRIYAAGTWSTTAVDQTHPEDREKVFKAADARSTAWAGAWNTARAKDGSWRTLESKGQHDLERRPGRGARDRESRRDRAQASGRSIPASAKNGGGGTAGALAGDNVLLTVSDNGVGMDATTRARVFEPFLYHQLYHQGKGERCGARFVHGVWRSQAKWGLH